MYFAQVRVSQIHFRYQIFMAFIEISYNGVKCVSLYLSNKTEYINVAISKHRDAELLCNNSQLHPLT